MYLQMKSNRESFLYGFISNRELNKICTIENMENKNEIYVQKGLPVHLDCQEIRDRSS
jgi:hypothetical protein